MSSDSKHTWLSCM